MPCICPQSDGPPDVIQRGPVAFLTIICIEHAGRTVNLPLATVRGNPLPPQADVPYPVRHDKGSLRHIRTAVLQDTAPLPLCPSPDPRLRYPLWTSPAPSKPGRDRHHTHPDPCTELRARPPDLNACETASVDQRHARGGDCRHAVRRLRHISSPYVVDALNPSRPHQHGLADIRIHRFVFVLFPQH